MSRFFQNGFTSKKNYDITKLKKKYKNKFDLIPFILYNINILGQKSI